VKAVSLPCHFSSIDALQRQWHHCGWMDGRVEDQTRIYIERETIHRMNRFIRVCSPAAWTRMGDAKLLGGEKV